VPPPFVRARRNPCTQLSTQQQPSSQANAPAAAAGADGPLSFKHHHLLSRLGDGAGDREADDTCCQAQADGFGWQRRRVC
jgi:hypothetical protein